MNATYPDRNTMCRFLFIVAFCFLEVLVQQTHGYTPAKATVTKQACAKALQTPANLIAIPGGGSALYVHRQCSGNSYETTAKCILKAFKLLPAWRQKMLDEKKLIAAWSKLCTQQKQYSSHASCYIHKRVSLAKCLMAEMKTISEQIQLGMLKFPVICGAMRLAVTCQQKVLQPCGSEAAKIITDFNQMALPSVCNNKGRFKRSAREVIKQEDINALLSAIRGLLI